MGLVLEGMGYTSHGKNTNTAQTTTICHILVIAHITESWLPTEDPTFVIPPSVRLTAKQLLLLEEAGIQQGAAFCLTDDGTLASPEAKRFKMKMSHSFANIINGSVRLVERSRGQFSLEFTYCATSAFRCTVRSNVLDDSTSSAIA